MMTNCPSCGGYFTKCRRTEWSFFDLLLKGKNITLQGITVAQCKCGMRPIVNRFDTLIAACRFIQETTQVWRWQDDKHWELIEAHSPEPEPEPEPTQVRGVSAFSRPEEEPDIVGTGSYRQEGQLVYSEPQMFADSPDMTGPWAWWSLAED